VSIPAAETHFDFNLRTVCRANEKGRPKAACFL
jgi:hypothetical protein